jgi:hypothetical protein
VVFTTKLSLRAVGFLIGVNLVAALSQASIIDYTSWTSDTLSTSTAAGSAAGTITTSQGTVTVTYSGDVASSTQINNLGIDYYTSWPAVYTNATVSNSPTNVDVIGLQEAQTDTDTLTFSTAVTNPILDIVSLGSKEIPVSYVFNAPPVILSQGLAYYSGCSTCMSVTGNTLTGTEGSGVVEFVGSFTSISWTTTGAEFWNGFTLGEPDQASGVPEPATSASVLIASILAVLFVRWRKTRLTA